MNKNEKPRLFGHQSLLTWNEILLTLGTIGIGIVLAVWPEITQEIVMCGIGAVGVVIGISFVVRYALLDFIDAIDSNALVLGLMWIAGGILIIVLRELLVVILPILLGFYLLFCGLTKIHYTLNLKRMGVKRWYLELVNACFSIILGTVTICRPFTAAYFLMRFIGIGLIIEALVDCASKLIYTKVHDRFMMSARAPQVTAAETENTEQQA